MNISKLQLLNQQYGIQNQNTRLQIKSGKGDIPVVEVNNKQAHAIISLQGAQLLSWIPVDENEVIWLSKDATFTEGKSVRGGVPICWPWFGAHHADSTFPAHGFARTSMWQIESVEELDDGRTSISFATTPQAEHEHMWPPETAVFFKLIIGKKLEMELTTLNNGSQPIVIRQALHSYFKVGNISQVILHGLNETDYLDKVENYQRKQQHGPVIINQEVDRIYLNTSSDCVIEDSVLKRKIIIKKTGSNSTVVWNPWQETARKMGDLGKKGYQKMLCVESSNAADDVVTIMPGKQHQLWVEYKCEHLAG